MKKFCLILFAAIALVFSSCGSKQYREWKSVYSKFEKAIDKAKDCDELEEAYMNLEEKREILLEKYEEEEDADMSEEEEDKIDEMEERIEKKLERREQVLCKD